MIAKAPTVGAHFNFTGAQWQAILSAVRDGCAQPSRFSRAGLLRVVNDYLEALPRHRPPTARAEAWARVSQLMEQTREAILRADSSGAWHAAVHMFEDAPGVGAPAEQYSILDVLDQWQRFASALARVVDAGERHPRILFFESVLDHWTDAGGWLRFSRSAPESRNAGKLSGPTIRYLQAVAAPVMWDQTPTLEGFRKILERCASHFEDMLANDEEMAAVAEAIQNGTDADAAAMAILTARAKVRPRRDQVRARARLLARGPRRTFRR